MVAFSAHSVSRYTIRCHQGSMVRRDKQFFGFFFFFQQTQEQNLIFTVKCGGGSVMMWSCFTFKGPGTLLVHMAPWTPWSTRSWKSACLCQDVTAGSRLDLPAGQWSETCPRANRNASVTTASSFWHAGPSKDPKPRFVFLNNRDWLKWTVVKTLLSSASVYDVALSLTQDTRL